MSIYENRSIPAYDEFVAPVYEQNQHILRWWSSDYDELIRIEIDKWAWAWSWGITDVLTKAIPVDILEQWKNEDSLCMEYAWYNVLMNFAVSRVSIKGFLENVRKSEYKKCLLCENEYREDSLPYPLIRRLGIDKLNYCAPCLSGIVFENTGNSSSTDTEIKKYLCSLSNLLGKVPNQGFGEGLNDLIELDSNLLHKVVMLLRHKPTTSRIKEKFGSWLNALIQADVLEDGTRKTARGTQTLAKDGHVCLSLGEKTIDDYLFSKGIIHEKEPHYPEGNYRADFLVGKVFVEYFGLVGNEEYDNKIALKKNICKRRGIELISIYPSDLISIRKLENKLKRL